MPRGTQSRSSCCGRCTWSAAPLLLIYVSALFATGLAPLVRIIERQRVRAISRRRVPRAAAILVIYATVIGTLGGIASAVVPPMVQQSQQFWKTLPEYMDQAQQKLTSVGPDFAGYVVQGSAAAGAGRRRRCGRRGHR